MHAKTLTAPALAWLAGRVPASTEFVTVAEAAVDDVLRLRPDLATQRGDHRYDDRLPDLSDSGVHGVATVLRGHLDALAAVDATGLDAQERVDLQMLRNGLERIVFSAEVLCEHEWNVLSHNAGDPLYLLMSRDTTPLEQRVNAIAGRLAALPDFLATTRRTITRSPRVHAETALAQHSGLRSLITTELDGTLDGDASLTALVSAPRAAALAALDEHEAWLHQLVGTADADPRIGAEAFARKLPMTLDSVLSAEEILRRARVNLDEQTDRLHETAAAFLADRGDPSTGSRDDIIRAALDALAADVPTDDTIVAVCETALTEITHGVRELIPITVPPDEMRIEVMPEFRRGVAVAYCDSPGPLEEGGIAYVAVAPTPAEWPAERVASFYREYNTAMLRNLMIHEAMPGHMLQIAHARKFRGTTRARRLFASSSFIEGWAVQCERLMADAGYGGFPVRLQQLKMQLRSSINAILDASVHAEGMTEAEALDLMTRRGFQEEGEAVGKWRRALLTSGQLSTYFVGYIELFDALDSRSAGESLDGLLAHGSPAPRYLRELLDSVAAPS